MSAIQAVRERKELVVPAMKGLGLVVSAVNGQRLYTNNQWPNPVVLKIENVQFNDHPEMPQVKSGTIDGAK